MKTLQNSYTTPEQSKRLLELGVPADSADMKYWEFRLIEDGDQPLLLAPSIPYSKTNLEFNSLPCWSVARLMEICKICEPKKDYEQLCEELKYCQNYCVLIISHIIANLQIIDFSKLEE